MKHHINKILLCITITYIIFLVLFHILGDKNRIGYLNYFNINIEKTLLINNLDILDIAEKEIQNNNDIKIYVYDFRINYYDKVFRNSDIYGVYPDLSNLPDYIKEAEMKENGNPYGVLTSDKYLQYDDKIDLYYKLSLKNSLYLYLVILILITFILNISKNKQFRNIYKLISNFIYNPINEFEYNKENKYINLYNVIFLLVSISMFLFIIFFANITPIFGDDYIFATNYEIYNIYNFNGKFFSRGRHMAEMFILFNMRPFGMFFINIFGLEPFWALKISQTILYTLYFILCVFSVSYLIFIFNNKNNFKLILLTVAPLVFLLFYKCEVAQFFVRVAAYVATAGISILAWLPIAYYFVYLDEMKFFKQNYILSISLWIPIMYFGTFTQEPSVWPLIGLTVMFILYLIIKFKFPNFLCEKTDRNFKIPISIIILVITHLSFAIIAFILTMMGIRGQNQLSLELGFQNIKLLPSDNYVKLILIFGFILLIYLIYNLVKYRRVNKLQYIQISLILTGIIGILLFLYIRVYYGITLCLIFIFIATILQLLKYYNNKKLISSITIVLLAVILYFELFLMYSEKAYNIKDKPDIIIHELFVEAEKLGKKEIVINKDIDKYEQIANYITINFPIYNSYISEFMQMYGITKDFIPIYRIDDISQLSNIQNQTNRINYR